MKCAGALVCLAIVFLVTLLENSDEGSLNLACFALGRIGPAARWALPALRRATQDPEESVRRFATQASAAIER